MSQALLIALIAALAALAYAGSFLLVLRPPGPRIPEPEPEPAGAPAGERRSG